MLFVYLFLTVIAFVAYHILLCVGLFFNLALSSFLQEERTRLPSCLRRIIENYHRICLIALCENHETFYGNWMVDYFNLRHAVSQYPRWIEDN